MRGEVDATLSAAVDPLAVALVLVALVAAYLIAVYVPWRKLYEAADRVEIPLQLPSLKSLAWRVRAVVDPERAFRESCAAYLRALPPHAGLTLREEWENECESLQSGYGRAAVRATLARSRRPSPYAVASARALAGRPRVRFNLNRFAEKGAAK